MNIHEYQSKELLKKYGVTVPVGFPVLNPDEIQETISKLNSSKFVIKAQIHAGGRGKAGGVKVISSHEEAMYFSEKIFGKSLVTHQTGPDGQVVRRMYIEEATDIGHEYYMSAVIDRATNSVMFVGSTEGGMDIEEVAEKSPEKIIKVPVDIGTGMQAYHVRKMLTGMRLDKSYTKKFFSVMDAAYRIITEKDACQVEINPLVETKDGDIIALDAKISFDSNALYRHPEIVELRDTDEEDEMEMEASKYDLNYVRMSGEIGCMVNGAGLAMATMDIIKHYGAEPANFLDVGGGATAERVEHAFNVILSDKTVKAILVNIFGGIVKCDMIAEGIIAAAKNSEVTVPVVVRLSGTNAELGKKKLSESDLNIISADTLSDAAQKVVKVV